MTPDQRIRRAERKKALLTLAWFAVHLVAVLLGLGVAILAANAIWPATILCACLAVGVLWFRDPIMDAALDAERRAESERAYADAEAKLHDWFAWTREEQAPPVPEALRRDLCGEKGGEA